MVTKQLWDQMFPERWGVGEEWKKEYQSLEIYYPQMMVDYYSYDNFKNAILRMSGLRCSLFANEAGATEQDRSREVAAFLATISYRTAKNGRALYYREEIFHERSTAGNVELYRNPKYKNYALGNKPTCFPQGSPKAGRVRFTTQSYHGRGPMQLTGDDNYGAFSEVVFQTPDTLLCDPNMLLVDGELAFMSAIWYWLRSVRPYGSAHQAMYKDLYNHETWGFGHTIVILSGGTARGGVEGGPTEVDRAVTEQIAWYRKYAEALGVTVGVNGEQLDTKGMFELITLLSTVHSLRGNITKFQKLSSFVMKNESHEDRNATDR
ncbi:unnamed protein product [Calicophoron daubneyi]|uniref:Glycoside hydrolase family 19 catalytic domain-containing protein n=1 Tax=Calicophoron daubneyi TaxID=300641 RepID=A0AAV2TY24_CALDB